MDQFSLSFQEVFEPVSAELQSLTKAIDKVMVARIVVVAAAVVVVVVVVVAAAAAAAAVAVAMAAAVVVVVVVVVVVTRLNRGFHHVCLRVGLEAGREKGGRI
jgi:ATP/ADP translocase